MANPLFRESQHFRQVWWVMLLILGVAALMWWGFIQQIMLDQPWGTNPAPDWAMWILWLFIGLGLPILFCYMGLIVELYGDRLLIRYVPFYHRSIAWDEISAVSAQIYKPIRQYGGWGIRGSGNRRAYSVRGDRGVEITLYNGQRIMLGSQKPEELALAIESQLSGKPG